tara:strand:+ start:467 stop:1036 length:570 start_codon:yes stop_codon:yes gene_type:complete
VGSWEEILSHFRFIEKDIDVSKIVSEIDPNDWDVAGTIKGAGGDLNPYGFLPLTMAVIDNEGDDPKNTEKQQNTPMFHRYKEIRRWLKTYKLHRHSRAAFFRLKPGESVGWHIDDGSYYLTRDRYHLSLQGTYKYWVGDEPNEKTAEMNIIEPGTFFWFDNKKYHGALNVSDVDRLTFVFDVPKSKKNP